MASTRYTGDDSDLRGWLLHDIRFDVQNISATESSYTEAGPRGAGAGDPTDASTAAVVEGLGDQDASITVDCLQGGLPGLSGMRFGWRLTADATTKLRGWQQPNVITGFASSDYSTNARDSLSAVTLRNGNVFSARREGAGTALTCDLWQSATATIDDFVATDLPGTVSEGIGLAIDADGRLYVLVEDVTALTGAGGWVLHRSEPDDIETWTEIARHPFLSPPTSGTDKLRLFVMPSGDLCLIGFLFDGASGTVRQWASSNGGATFVAVDNTESDTTTISDAVLTASGKVGVAHVTAANVLNWYSTATPWASVMESTAVQITTAVAEAWVAADPTGRIWVWARSSASADRITVHYSDDDGATWVVLLYGLTDQVGDVGQFLTKGQAVHTLGAFMLVCQATDGAAAGDDTTRWIRLGGFSSVVTQWGDQLLVGTLTSMLGSGYTAFGSFTGCVYLPICEPADLTCWTATGAGTGQLLTSTAFTGWHEVATAANTKFYDSTAAPGTTNAVHIVEAELACTVGGSLTSRQVCLQSILSNGATASELSVVFSTAGLAVMDAAGVLATVALAISATPVIVRIVHVYAGRGEVYYRRPYESFWTRAYSVTTLSTTAVATSRMRWGHSVASTSTSVWAYVWHKTGANTNNTALIGSPASAFSSWQWMLGRQLTGLAAPIDLLAASTAGEGTQVLSLRGTDGPAVAGDAWTLEPVYDHPIENLLPTVQPSPRRTWRSTAKVAVGLNTSTVSFVFEDGLDTSLSRNIGLAVFNANVRYVLFTAATGGGAHTTLGTMDLATGFTGLSYTRAAGSNVLRITGTADATRYVWRNELVGATVSLDATTKRKILRHTEGIWSDAAGKHVEIVLDGIADTEPTSGTMDIWARNGVLVIHGVSALYDEYAVSVVATGTNADGYHELGTIVVGSLVAAGQSPSWGDVATYEPNASTWTSRDQVSRVRRLGPAVRTWTWAWPDGIDLSRLRDASPTPDFLAHTAGTEGIANLNDTPYLVAGMLEEVRSGEIPMVAMAYIPATSGTTITDPSLFMLCRLTSSVGIENIQGDIESDAVVRVSPITMREIA